MLDKIRKYFKSEYLPHEQMSVDETLVSFKGRLGLRQFMKDNVWREHVDVCWCCIGVLLELWCVCWQTSNVVNGIYFNLLKFLFTTKYYIFQKNNLQCYYSTSQLIPELVIDAKLAPLSELSFGLLKMRRTLAPLPHLSMPLMSWLMIICCWKTSWCAIAATYCGLILTRG